MNVQSCELPGLLVFEPRALEDERGFFLEAWNQRRYAEFGIDAPFVQDSLSFSRCGTLRGLHFQNPRVQGKLVSVLQGEVFDVAVDLRRGSAMFGRWLGASLSEHNRKQLYIPPGFAHGFQVVSETALFFYKCTDYYSPGDEVAIRWNDPELAIPWPIEKPIVSAKDAKAPRLRELPEERLFV
jgi:dTDP-4-dehydrorhamnose 3,5-epimerase